MMADAPSLAVTRLRLRFAPCSPGRQAGLVGSAWRGGMGQALRRAVCRTGADTCAGCAFLHECDYSLAFETPAPPGEGPQPDAAPHPFGLLARTTPVGEEELTLALYGSGARFLAPLLQALRDAAAAGIGPERVRYRLDDLSREASPGTERWRPLGESSAAAEPAPVPAPPARCRVSLVTPLRLRRAERYLGPAEFRFGDLGTNLMRRVSALCRLYGTPFEADFRALSALADSVELESARLRWHDWTRFSSRQQRPIKMGGLLGEFDLAPPPELWPFLWLGQFVQAGKGTALGLGHIEVQSL